MILSANHYRVNVDWYIEIEITSTPSVLTVSDSFGDRTFPFTQTGNVLRTVVQARNVEFTVTLDTEVKVMMFYDGEQKDFDGDVEAPSDKGSTASIYIPIADLPSLKVQYYTMQGSVLRVQAIDRTPPWRLNGSLSSRSLFGKSYQLSRLIVNDTDSAYFLASSENNIWQKLSTIPYRVAVSGIKDPNSNVATKLVADPRFYGKRFYADF